MAVDLGALVVRLRADMRGFTSGLSKAQQRMRTFSARLQGSMQANAAAMQRFGRTAVVVGAAVSASLVGMIKKFGNFELAMRKATTATATTQQEFAELSQFVEEQAAALNISAIKAAEGLKFLGFAGLTAQQQMQAFPPLLALSKAGMADMGLVTEKLLGVMGAFQISFDKTGEVADKIAKIWGASQQTLEELTTAFSFTAAGAAEMGISIGELGALTALMAKAGIKGSRAGTTLRRTFLNLKAPTSELRTLLADLGIKTEDANGKFRNGIDVLDDFFEATENLGATARATAFKVAFGARAVEGLKVVANRGTIALREFADSVENASGTVDIMVERRMKALNEQLGVASREFGRLFRTIGQQFEPEARQLADAMKEVVTGLREWIKENEILSKILFSTALAAGVMTAAAGTLTIALAGLALAATLLEVSMATLAIRLSVLVGGLTIVAAVLGDVVAKQLQFAGELRSINAELKKASKQVETYKETWERLTPVLKKTEEGLKLVKEQIAALSDLQGAISELRELEAQLKEFNFLEKTFSRKKFNLIKGRIEALKILIVTYGKTVEVVTSRAEKEFKEIKGELETPPKAPDMSALTAVFTKVGEAIGDSLVDNLSDMITGVENWRDAVLNIVNDMTREITRAFTRMFLQEVFRSAFFNTPGGFNFGRLLFPVAQPAATQELSRGGIVNPVFAASGFVARGTDTVPAMLTPGEAVLPKSLTNALMNQGGGGGGGVNITIQAIDTQTGINFLLRHKNTIASALQSAGTDNHPFRRGQG